jgi:2-dehydro-3-deoxygluconokinase
LPIISIDFAVKKPQFSDFINEKQKVMRQFVAIGEAMLELSQQQERVLGLSFAGDTLNTSLYLARLSTATQVQVNYLTLLGLDPYSAMMLKAWQQEGVNTDLVQQIPDKLPGLYLIRTDARGERTFYFYRSQSAARELFNKEHAAQMENALLQMDFIYLSNITLAILESEKYQRLFKLLEKAKSHGATLIFDTNYRPSLWPSIEMAKQRSQEVLGLVDIALVTFDDEKKLFNDALPEHCVARLQRFGVNEIVVKCGAEPCVVASDNQQYLVDAHPVKKVIDTTSAGDAFNAGYLAARWQNYSPKDAAVFGHRLASVVIQYPGAIIPQSAMPTLFGE